MNENLTSDTFFNGNIIVYQNSGGYRFSVDAVLLSDFINPPPKTRILDLGTGSGIIPLLLSFRHKDIRLAAIEIQDSLYQLAAKNVAENGLHERIKVFSGDMKEFKTGDIEGPFDYVVSNPPYRVMNSGRINPEKEKAIARHEICITLADLIACAKRFLNHFGKLCIIYPAERLTDLIWTMRHFKIEPSRLQPVQSFTDSDAELVLIEGVKGGKNGVIFMPPLIIYQEGKKYTKAVEKMFCP